MAKSLKDFNLEIGARFKKGVVTLVLLRIERGMAVFHRSYKGTSRRLEVVSLGHLKSCPTIYQRLEVEA